ncbi:MAG: serine hydroxymethyltransferase [Stappiaceae bacterium]
MSAETGGNGAVYFELRRIAQQIRVAAIDGATGVEVSVFGPASASEADLKSLALRKLQRRLSQLDE